MLTLAPTVRLYVCTTPVDMRRSFNGLANSTRELVGADPLSGALFVFFNRNKNLCKAIWWSSGGFCIFAKRLARGRFRVPSRRGNSRRARELRAERRRGPMKKAGVPTRGRMGRRCCTVTAPGF